MEITRWISNVLLEIIKYFLIVFGVLGYNIKVSWKNSAVLLYLLVGISAISFVEQNTIVYSFIGGFILIFTCFEESITMKIKGPIIGFLAIATVDLLVWSLFVNAFPQAMDAGWPKNLSASIGCAFWLLIAIVIKDRRKMVYHFFAELSMKWFWLFVVPIFGMGLIAGGIQGMLLGFDISRYTWSEVLCIYMVVMVFFIAVSILYIYVFFSKKKLELLHEAEKENLHLQQKYYEGKIQQQEEIQKFRHDVKKHMSVIKLLCEENRIEDLRAYVTDFCDAYPEREIVYTGNIISDYYISALITELSEREGFQYDVIGRFPEKLYISNIDLCILIANAIENARNAILQMDTPGSLWVEIKNYEKHLIMTIKNSKSPKKVEVRNGEIDGGGYGIKNMMHVAEKYGGSIVIEEDEETFTLKISV